VKRLLVNVALSVVVSLLFLGALEGVVRLFTQDEPLDREVADYIWDWDEKMPGGFYVMRSEAVGWPPWQEFNGDGLRDRTRAREKPDGVWRVAILGDSVTLGDGLKAYEAYPQVLEARLQAAGERIEVMNVALWGWSTRQERIAWERIAKDYHPDEAILAVCLNDIPELQNNLTEPPRWLLWLHQRSALVRLLVDARGREIGSVETLFTKPDAPRVKEGFDLFFEEIRTLREEVEAEGATLALVVFPFRFQLVEGAPSPVAQERIVEFCRTEEMTCLDLLPTLRRLGDSAFLDYDHLSRSGAALTADTLLASPLLPEGYSNPQTLRRSLQGRPGAGAATVEAWLEQRDRPVSDRGLQRLIEALDDGDPSVKMAAAWALGTLGDAATEAVPRLASTLREDPSPGVRAAAARALGATEGDAAVTALFDALWDPHEAVRHEAAQALSRLKLSTDDISRLAEALESDDLYVRAFAAWRLGNFGEEAKDAVPALVRELDDPRDHVVVSASLARIGPGAVAAVPALLDQCSSADHGRRWRAAKALGRIGPGAAEGVPALVALLSDPNERVRLHAARALGRIGPEARSAAGALQEATGDPDGGVRREAEKALRALR
jgi:HEAT repeat protein